MGVRNTFVDLHNMLMEEMERLNDEDMTTDQLHHEIARAQAMSKTATSISNNARVMLDAERMMFDYNVNNTKSDDCLRLITGGKNGKEN